jgi:hypothetical protein
LGWITIATASYFLVSPPASLFPQRLSLVLFIPGFLFMAMTLADAARTLSSRLSVIVTPGLALAFLGVTGLLREPTHDPFAFERLGETFQMINRLQLKPDAKVYASPSSNHVLTFYSNKPIQSIAPVRKSFLDSYSGEILYIERQFNWEFTAPSVEEIRAAAVKLDESLTKDEIADVREKLKSRFAREKTAPLVAEVEPPLAPLSPLEEEIMRQTRQDAEKYGNQEEAVWTSRDLPFARGFRIRSYADLWQTFFYRLVDPKARGGAAARNAAERLRHGRAYFVPSANRVLIYSPAPTARQHDGGGNAR